MHFNKHPGDPDKQAEECTWRDLTLESDGLECKNPILQGDI